MTNFIFKSPSDLQKISQQLQVILAEQRHQRADLQYLKTLCQYLKHDKNLQETVDKYYKEAPDFIEPVGTE